jgi:hypothetical protein
MSTQLEQQGIALIEGYDPAQLEPAPDLVVIGNAMSRGNPCVEAVLDRRIPYTSGPQWLLEHVLQHRWVLAVAGTHGKTTTASMLAWVLEDAAETGLSDRWRAGQFRGVRPPGRVALLRGRGGRVRQRLLRQALQVCALPAAHPDPQQPGV